MLVDIKKIGRTVGVAHRITSDTGARASAALAAKANGQAQRFIQSALCEWAYGPPYTHSDR
jgi:hypothetical protein